MACSRNFLVMQILCLSAGVMLLSMLLCTSAQGNGVTGQHRRLLQVCVRNCLDVSYTTCTSSGNEQLQAYCNCCFARAVIPEGGSCTLHLTNGTQVTCPYFHCVGKCD